MRIVPCVVLLAAGCAPTLTGADQVPDVNVNFVGSADEALDDMMVPDADQIVEDLIADHGGTGGCALGLVEDGVVTYLKGYGLADEAPVTPYDVDTMAPVGSISKTLTALGILRLVEEGDITSLDDPADLYLPVDEELGDATINELLTHGSGAGSPSPILTGNPAPEDMAQPRLAYQNYAPNEALDGSPGDYSNLGYAVLGAVIDELTSDGTHAPADGYERWIWHEVGRGTLLSGGSPTLALVHSWRADDIATLAEGYDALANPYPAWEDPTVGLIEGWEGPPGGWTMTIGDLARLVASIQRREIVSATSWSEATLAWETVYGRPYGYGLWHESITGGQRLNHGGAIAGYSAFWASYETTSDTFGVALQCNFQDPYALDDAADAIYGALVAGGLGGVGIGFNEAPVGTTGINGQTYDVDVSQGTAHPFGIPGSEIAADLQISVFVPRGSSSPDLTLKSAVAGAMPSTTWRAARFSDPGFTTGTAQTVQLPTTTGPLVTLEGALLSGNFGARGTTIDQLTLTGNVDTRTIPTVWTLGADVCEEARLAGTPCEPCADGAPVCVPVTITGWTGAR